jgi:hypothetical protein
MRLITWALALTGVAVGTTVVSASGAIAASFTFNYTNPIGSEPTPSGAGPWLTALIEDQTANIVKITLTNTTPGDGLESGTDPYNTINGVVFNLKNASSLSISALSCTPTGTVDCVSTNAAETIRFAPNNIALGAGGTQSRRFDLSLELPPPPSNSPSDSMGPGDIVAFVLKNTGTGAFSADSFNAVNFQGWTTLAKVQAIGGSGPSSVICSSQDSKCRRKIPAPLPILGAAAGFGLSRRLRRRIQASSSASVV